MTPDIVVDIGNSRMKWGRVTDGKVAEMVSLSLTDEREWNEQLAKWQLERPMKWAMAGVNPSAMQRFEAWASNDGVRISSYRQIPLEVAVEQPEQVGIDRLINGYSAYIKANGQPVITVSVGTAITVDAVDTKGAFLGGAILPGPYLMAKSLHENTAKLPMVEIDHVHTIYYPAKDTSSAITIGIWSAVCGAIRELILGYSQLMHTSSTFRDTSIVFLTGGGSGRFEDVESIERWTPFPDETRIAPLLTLEGIRLVAERLG